MIIESHMAGQLDMFKTLGLEHIAVDFNLCLPGGIPTFTYPLHDSDSFDREQYDNGRFAALVSVVQSLIKKHTIVGLYSLE